MKKTSSTSNLIALSLNSFVRRTQNTSELKQLIVECGGALSRKGRSRNWTLQLPFDQRKKLIDRLYQADQSSWLWVAKLLAEPNNKKTYEADELELLVRDNPSITLNELISLTDCSLAEARHAIDRAEWSD